MNAPHPTPPPRPIALQGDLQQLPDAFSPLKDLPNWVCWRWQWTVNKRGEGKWTKPPFQPRNTAALAKNNDPSTWGTYDEALAAFEAGTCDGIGFCLVGTGIGAFDLDKCRDPDSGEISPEGMAIVDRATSYTELTVSGTGLRVIGYGHGVRQHRKQKIAGSPVEVETYRDAERYIVVSGKPLPGTWPHLGDIDAEIDAVVAELDGSKPDNVFDFNNAQRQRETITTGFLPRELVELVERGPAPSANLSNEFHHAVCWLADCGWSAAKIESYIVGKPITPERYAHRLANEIARSLRRRERDKDKHDAKTDRQKPPAPIEIFWHGDGRATEARPWLIDKLLPATGQGLMSGQWGTAKTFAALDLSASVMTGMPFANRHVARCGGVLFIAVEGASEIPVRLRGLVEQKIRPAALAEGAAGNPIDADLDRLPFAWIEVCPSLKEDEGFAVLVAAAQSAARHMKAKHGVELVLIVIDTLNAAANFKDGNDSAEGQVIMNRLGELSRRTGALTLAVDHFGKVVETGTRGTSAKEAAADVVLALLADRDIGGTISNTRMAVRKLRAGATGAETPFDLKVVDIGEGETTCIIQWKPDHSAATDQTSKRERWPRSLRIFRASMTTALIEQGKPLRPYNADGPAVKAVPEATVRAEFMKAYPADGEDDKRRQDAKRAAFNRALKAALDRSLVGAREVGGIDHLWLVDDHDTHADGPDTS